MRSSTVIMLYKNVNLSTSVILPKLLRYKRVKIMVQQVTKYEEDNEDKWDEQFIVIDGMSCSFALWTNRRLFNIKRVKL